MEKTLLGFLGDRLNISEAGFIRGEVIERLQQNVEATVIDEYFACIDVCAVKRFAPRDATKHEMEELLQRAEEIMTELERGTS